VAVSVVFTVATGHLNHATVGESLKQKVYVSSLSKKRLWGGCALYFRQLVKKKHNTTHSYLILYTLVKLNLSLVIIKIAERDTGF